MIDIRKLKELVRLMVSHDLTEVDLRDAEEQVTLRRHTANFQPHAGAMPGSPGAPPPGWFHAIPSPAGGAPLAPEMADVDEAEAEAADEAGLHRIVSPMVGTFYTKANPDAATFVTPGSQVQPETVVCLIEAMKIFNEIKAECSGTIQKVLVANGQAVEFGQPLFLVKPS